MIRRDTARVLRRGNVELLKDPREATEREEGDRGEETAMHDVWLVVARISSYGVAAYVGR